MARIAVVSPFPPLRGGIAHFAAHAAAALEQRGHLAIRCSFRRLYPDFVFPGKSQFEPGGQTDSSAGIDGTNPFSWRVAGRDLREAAPDLVLAAYWTPLLAPAIGFVARAAGAPVIALVHNARPHERIPGGDAVARWFFGRCDGALALSDGVAAQIRELEFGGPVRTTPHPVYDHFGPAPDRDEARQTLGVGTDGRLLLFFGLVRAYKGLDVLVEAMARVRREAPDVRLLVAGEWYEKRKTLDARIAELGLGDAVTIDDRYVPDDRVPTLFGAADVVVLPYRSGTQSGVLETAAGYGLPVVVTDVGGLAAPVREFSSGLVVKPADSESLAAALLQALEPATNATLREGAGRMKAAHGWDPFVTAVEGLAVDAAARRREKS